MRIAWILWSGALGGTENLAGELVGRARARGHDARVIFLGAPTPLADGLDARGIPYDVCPHPRGVRLLLRSRTLARDVAVHAGDGVVLPTSGLLPLALGLGDYPGRIVAVEHGALLAEHRLPTRRRYERLALRRLASRYIDVEVGVSNYMLARLRDGNQARSSVCIRNGVDIERFRPSRSHLATAETTVFGWGGRLIPGKGVDLLLKAAAGMRAHDWRVRIAGDGPERERLLALSASCGVVDRVAFLGPVHDMPAFWQSCDVAVSPADEFVESFGLAAVEASACGLPVIASDAGALPEVVEDGVTGTVVRAGAVEQLSAAMAAYVTSPQLRAEHGAAGRRRATTLFSLEQCLEQYLAALARRSSDRFPYDYLQS